MADKPQLTAGPAAGQLAKGSEFKKQSQQTKSQKESKLSLLRINSRWRHNSSNEENDKHAAEKETKSQNFEAEFSQRKGERRDRKVRQDGRLLRSLPH